MKMKLLYALLALLCLEANRVFPVEDIDVSIANAIVAAEYHNQGCRKIHFDSCYVHLFVPYDVITV